MWDEAGIASLKKQAIEIARRYADIAKYKTDLGVIIRYLDVLALVEEEGCKGVLSEAYKNRIDSFCTECYLESLFND